MIKAWTAQLLIEIKKNMSSSMARKPTGKEEHWQFQDGVGNIKIEAPVDGKTPLQINTNIRYHCINLVLCSYE